MVLQAMYGATALEINPVHAYPWPLVTRNDRPMVTSAEMAVVYRFHEFIINNFNLTVSPRPCIRLRVC
jgi:peroxidase